MSKSKEKKKVMQKIEQGERRTVWVPNELDNLIEDTRKKLGMNRSAFFKYAVNRLLEELSVLTTTVHRETKKAENCE